MKILAPPKITKTRKYRILTDQGVLLLQDVAAYANISPNALVARFTTMGWDHPDILKARTRKGYSDIARMRKAERIKYQSTGSAVYGSLKDMCDEPRDALLSSIKDCGTWERATLKME